jgi:antitoxin component YwqK of YwqJK toxin-antitoxin module
MIAASCFGEKFNLAQILLNNKDKHSIFTCQISKTYVGSGGFTSIAVVRDVFRGNPMDTIRIVTGGHTTEGGTKLKPGTNWLIVSETQDNYQYTATICHNHSKPMTENDIGCGYRRNIYGEDIVNVTKQIDELKAKGFSGSKKLYLKEMLIAEGNYSKGSADGIWKHYNHRIDKTEQNLEVEIEYIDGIPNGKTIRYVLEYLPLTIESIVNTKNGKLISKYVYNDRFYKYTYSRPNVRLTKYYRLNEVGDTITHYQEIGHKNPAMEDYYLYYKDGIYLNLVDSSSYNCLCSGRYYKGAKVGTWKYYDKNGKIINQETYKLKDTLISNVKMYEEDGSFKVIGRTSENKPVGQWKYYHDSKLEYEVFYDQKSEIITNLRYYNSGGKKVTPYKDGKPHGTEHRYYKSGVLNELTNYNQGIKNGLHYKFDEEGILIYHSNFLKGIETTIYRADAKANILDGFRSGYNIQLNYKTGEKLHEGKFWMGYRIGKYISYKKNEDYTISYYETNKDILVSNCESEFPRKILYYNKDNKLIK